MNRPNYRRVAAAAITVWLVSIPFGAFLHHGVLGRIYVADAAAFRPDAEVLRRLPLGYAFALLGCFGAALMYAEMSPRRFGVVQGIRFGLLISLVIVSFAIVWNYVTQPISPAVGLAEGFEYVVSSSLYGAIIGVIYRPGIRPIE